MCFMARKRLGNIKLEMDRGGGPMGRFQRSYIQYKTIFKVTTMMKRGAVI